MDTRLLNRLITSFQHNEGASQSGCKKWDVASKMEDPELVQLGRSSRKKKSVVEPSRRRQVHFAADVDVDVEEVSSNPLFLFIASGAIAGALVYNADRSMAAVAGAVLGLLVYLLMFRKRNSNKQQKEEDEDYSVDDDGSF